VPKLSEKVRWQAFFSTSIQLPVFTANIVVLAILPEAGTRFPSFGFSRLVSVPLTCGVWSRSPVWGFADRA
jgi:hypothetical protein